jgi:hypothetical protein
MKASISQHINGYFFPKKGCCSPSKSSSLSVVRNIGCSPTYSMFGYGRRLPQNLD